MYKIGLLVAAGIFLAGLNAQAQYPYNAQKSTTIIQPGSITKGSFKRESHKAMENDISIPEIPRFPGAKFVSGDEAQPSENLVCGYTIDYAVQQRAASQVIPFYHNVLSSGGWKIDQEEENSITSKNENSNSHCHIYVDEANDKDIKLHINYAVTPKVTYQGER